MSEDDRAHIRNQYVGFVFQNFQFLNAHSTRERNGAAGTAGKNVSAKAKTYSNVWVLGSACIIIPRSYRGSSVAMARAFITDPENFYLLTNLPVTWWREFESRYGSVVLLTNNNAPRWFW